MTRIMPPGWALPAINNLNRPFFTSGNLIIQRCAACGTAQHPPEEVCHACLGMEFEGRETSGLGTIASFVVVHYPVAPALNDVVPYAVALVALEDMPTVRVVGNVLNRGPRDLAIGQRVRAVFEEIPGGDGEETILLPQWEAVE